MERGILRKREKAGRGGERGGGGGGGGGVRWVQLMNTTVDGEDIAIETCRSIVLVQQRLWVQRFISHMVKSFHSDNFLDYRRQSG